MQDYKDDVATVEGNTPSEEPNTSNSKRSDRQKDKKAPAQAEVSAKDVAEDKEDDKTTADKTARTTSRQAFMYLGPNIPGGRLFSGSVIRGGSPNDLQHLQDVLEKLPEIKGLFVEVAKVPKFKEDVRTQGTEAHRLYTVVVSQLKKGVLKDGI